MANYCNVRGVRISEWDNDTGELSTEPAHESWSAELEEMYFDDSGNLVIRLSDDDADRFFDIEIPAKHTDGWSGFVASLPE